MFCSSQPFEQFILVAGREEVRAGVGQRGAAHQSQTGRRASPCYIREKDHCMLEESIYYLVYYLILVIGRTKLHIIHSLLPIHHPGEHQHNGPPKASPGTMDDEESALFFENWLLDHVLLLRKTS